MELLPYFVPKKQRKKSFWSKSDWHAICKMLNWQVLLHSLATFNLQLLCDLKKQASDTPSVVVKGNCNFTAYKNILYNSTGEGPHMGVTVRCPKTFDHIGGWLISDTRKSIPQGRGQGCDGFCLWWVESLIQNSYQVIAKQTQFKPILFSNHIPAFKMSDAPKENFPLFSFDGKLIFTMLVVQMNVKDKCLKDV